MTPKIRPIAIHLPQFHPIPENDMWWGRGFTEWTNVAKAKPIFKGHYQPHLPTDLGFYDLRLAEAREAQADLARAYGIHGFCYYHYWFNGRRLLERPVEEILKSGAPDFPFMLCWANENWTRRWDGSEHTILMKQEYTDGDAIQHARALVPYFKDPRYIRIDGRPVFAFYKPRIITNIESYLELFRREAEREGIELYLCRVECEDFFRKEKAARCFDAAIEFQPMSEMFSSYMHWRYTRSLGMRGFRKFRNKFLSAIGRHDTLNALRHGEWFHLNYQGYVNFLLKNYQYPKDYKRFPGLTPMWDNTARRGRRSILLHDSTPEKYGEWLEYHLKNYQPPSPGENLLFINAWNEWAEGNHLEPCAKWGRRYLEVTKSMLDRYGSPSRIPESKMAELSRGGRG